MTTTRATHSRDSSAAYPAKSPVPPVLARKTSPLPSPAAKQPKPRTPLTLRWLRAGLVAVLLGLGVVGAVNCARQFDDINSATTQVNSAISREQFGIDLIQAHETTAIAALGPNAASKQLPTPVTDALADALTRVVDTYDTGSAGPPDSASAFVEFANTLDRAARASNASSAQAELAAAAAQLDGLLPEPTEISTSAFGTSALNISMIAGLCAAAVVVGASVVVARVTHRVVNPGLLVAFVCSLGIAFGPLSFSEELEQVRSNNVAMSAVATARYDVALAVSADLRAALTQSGPDVDAEGRLADAEAILAHNYFDPDLTSELSAYGDAHRKLVAMLEAKTGALDFAISTADDAPSALASRFDKAAAGVQAHFWSYSNTFDYRLDLALIAGLLIAPLAIGGAVGASLGVRQALRRHR